MKLKFRAYYKPDFDSPDGALKFEQKIIDDELKFVYDEDIRYSFDIVFLDDDWIIQQYTGLKDKNGVEIYVGDILDCPWGFEPEEYSRGYVVFWKGAFCLAKGVEEDDEMRRYVHYDLWGFNDTPTRSCFWENAEILGNIYENPEFGF